MKAASRDPDVLGGEPVFAGTRVPVRSLFDHLENGDSIEDFLAGFPSVHREQVVAVLEDVDDLTVVAKCRGEPAGVQHSRDGDRSPRRPTDTGRRGAWSVEQDQKADQIRAEAKKSLGLRPVLQRLGSVLSKRMERMRRAAPLCHRTVSALSPLTFVQPPCQFHPTSLPSVSTAGRGAVPSGTALAFFGREDPRP